MKKLITLLPAVVLILSVFVPSLASAQYYPSMQYQYPRYNYYYQPQHIVTAPYWCGTYYSSYPCSYSYNYNYNYYTTPTYYYTYPQYSYPTSYDYGYQYGYENNYSMYNY